MAAAANRWDPDTEISAPLAKTINISCIIEFTVPLFYIFIQ